MRLPQTNRLFATLIVVIAAAGLSACSALDAAPDLDSSLAARKEVGHYGALGDEKFPVPALNLARIKERKLRQIVDFKTAEHPGTIVIDTDNRFLYLVQEQGTAIRYGIGVGIDGLEFTGSAVIGFKRQWPRWTPTADMIRRNPDLYAKWQGGMEGGPTNPLGARALYLFKDGKDTLFRIHGTAEPHTIGRAVSSGCIRMFNHDVIDLYRRVPTDARVVVLAARVATAGGS